VARPFRQQVDEGILDRAAGLFARHGFEQTSLQAVADAVGLSKAGLLHHFPSKGALHEAVMDQAEGLGRRAVGALASLAVLSLAAHQADQTTGWRRHIVATCLDALGHRRPGALLPDLDQVEA
jgi:AcrR family transcriptional regulator